MKKYILLTLLLTSFIGLSQNFSRSKVRKFRTYGIDVTTIDTNNPANYNNLKLILQKDKKRRKNLFNGTVLTTLSVLAAYEGFRLRDQERVQGKKSEPLSAKNALAIAAASFVISLPIHSKAKKKRKQRDELIWKFNQDYYPY